MIEKISGPIDGFNIKVINSDSTEVITRNDKNPNSKGIHLKLDLSNKMKNVGTYFDDEFRGFSVKNRKSGEQQSIFDNAKIMDELNLEPI